MRPAAALALALAIVLAGCGTTAVQSHGGSGTEFTFRAVVSGKAMVTHDDLVQAETIMRARLDKLGADGKLRLRGSRIVVRIDGVDESAGPIIGANGQLDLYDMTPALLSPSVSADGDSAQPYTTLFALLSAVQPTAGSVRPRGYVLFKPVKSKAKTVFVVARGGIGSGEPAMNVREVTTNEATRGLDSGTGSSCGDTCAFAIVLDNQIRSYPTIDPSQNPQGIDPAGSGVQITFGASPHAILDAKQLTVVLQSGALPVHSVLVSERPAA